MKNENFIIFFFSFFFLFLDEGGSIWNGEFTILFFPHQIQTNFSILSSVDNSCKKKNKHVTEMSECN